MDRNHKTHQQLSNTSSQIPSSLPPDNLLDTEHVSAQSRHILTAAPMPAAPMNLASFAFPNNPEPKGGRMIEGEWPNW